MPRKKVTEVSGNGGMKRKRGGGRKKDQDFSSDDEFDDFEQENTKKPGKPASKAGLQPVTVADDVKEKIVSVSGTRGAGQLAFWSRRFHNAPLGFFFLFFPQKLELPKVKGQLLIFGATNWDLIGRKEVPKQQAAYRNLGQNLWGPHRYGCLSDVQVSCVVSGPCAAHSLIITTEGKLWSWGRNEKGQLGHGDTKRLEAPKLVEALVEEVVVSAACGRNHTLALTENGTVYSFGENKLGQLGQGNQTDAVLSPATIQYNGQPLVKVSCGAEFSMVVDCKGNLYSFGCPEYGQLGHNSDGKFIARAQRIEFDCELIPRRVAIFIERTKDGQVLPVPNVVARDVACGANHTLVLDSQKRVFSWGFGGYGRLGHTEQKDEMVPRLVKLFDFPGRGASQIYCGYQCSFAVSEMGGLFFWGVTNTSRESTMYPKAVQDLCGWKIRSLACGRNNSEKNASEKRCNKFFFFYYYYYLTPLLPGPSSVTSCKAESGAPVVLST
uniref:RCC1-like domain-containing protein n=1 Tax=Denticeps clupeoides TaxID=299321 RepID=A0AAY4DI72_9TELE